MKKILFLVFVLSLVKFGFSQDIKYARKTLRTLCSPEFGGRGYVNDGDKIAANFIKSELEKMGIKPVGKKYIQYFRMPINTFPLDMMVKLDDNELVPGVDYLVHANSNTIKGSFPIAWINKKVVESGDALKNLLSNNLHDYFIVLDTAGIKDKDILDLMEFIKFKNPVKAKGIVEIVYGNLTYVPSQKRNSFPLVEIVNGKISVDNKVITVDVKSKFERRHKAGNVVAYIPGKVDSFFVFTAHLDHLGRMGQDIYFPGANDNASGTTMVLDLARYYSSLKEKPYYSMMFIWFAGEEAGLLGSKYFTEHPLVPLDKISYLFNLDMVGSGDKGIKIVNGSVFKDVFKQIVDINNEKQYLPKVSPRGAAANSDHYFFYDNGVRSFFIYTLGEYKEYHNIYDRSEALPLCEYEDLFRLLVDFVKLQDKS